MQEEVENRTVNLAISTTRLTGRTLVTAFNAWKRHHDAKAKMQTQTDDTPHGKQTIKELIGQDQGVSSIPIGSTGIRDFERIANKYGVDYAIVKDKAETPPKFLVFFKARDADALTQAFTEYSSQQLKMQKKPSILKQLQKLRAIVASIPNKVRQKTPEHDL